MILLDTHVLFWSRNDQRRIPRNVMEIVRDSPTLCIAAISLWEMAMLVRKRRIDLGIPIENWIGETLGNQRFRLLPLSPEIAVQSCRLEMHGDPADRLIVASSLIHQIPLITADRLIQKLDFVNAVW